MMAINLRDYSRTAAQRGWGAGWPSCGGAKAAGTAIVTADLSGTRMSVHKRIARLVDLLCDATERRGFRLKPGQCGGYNCRAISGTRSPSNHSWGLAVDINWNDNPYTTNPRLRTIPDWMVAQWNRYGFAWGGHYTGSMKDYMHFEFMGTPGQADQMTALALAELAPGAAPPPAATQPMAPPAPTPRRLHQEDTEMFIETPEPAPGTDIRQWPRKRFYYGFDPKGGWGGNGIIRINFGPRGGCVHLARWWQRNPDWDPNNRNRMHFWDHPLTPGGHTFAIAEDWQLDLRTAASGIEFDLAAPDGVHIFPVYQK